MAAKRIANPVGLFEFEHNITHSDEEMIQASQEIEKPQEEVATVSDEELLSASQIFEIESSSNMETVSVKKPERRFVQKTDDELKEVARNAVPIQTRKKALWAAGVFDQWRVWRNQKAETDKDISIVHPPLQMLTKDELDFCLCRFICEVRKADGAEYPGKTCYEIVTSIQKYLEINGKCFKLLSDTDFKQFQLTLDSEMKAREGVNKPVKQAEFIDDDKEDRLWQNKTLGDDSPVKLVHTVIYLAGINFCARGRTELRNLTYGQVKVEEDGDGKRLRYRQMASVKNNQGGLKSRHHQPKDVSVCQNLTNPERCSVRLFELYISKW